MEENQNEIVKVNTIRHKIKKNFKEFSNLIFSVRFLVTVMIFLGVALQSAQKIDMGIAIVCMVNHTALNDSLADINDNTSLANYTFDENIRNSKHLVII
jgi:hypothetical protein